MEVLIVVGLLAVVCILAFAPLASSLAQTQREASMLTMDLSAKRSFSRIGSALSHALVPITTYAGHEVPVAKNKIATFQDLLNSDAGFATHGGDWGRLLANGTDFLPFTIPVDFGGDGDTLDSQLALELGIVLPDGREVAVGGYSDHDGQNVLDGSVGCLHPSLAHLSPADFDEGVGSDSSSAIDLSLPRFAERPAFSSDQEGFGLLRFVPARRSTADGEGWVTIDEKELTQKGNGSHWDLNDDGQVADVYAVGHLELLYIGREGETMRKPVSGPDILLQLNRDSPSWKPLFKLVRQSAKDSASNDDGEDSTTSDVGGYALLINLLVFDQSVQSGSPLAFNETLPYLVRRHQTMIELRNMSNANLLKNDS